MATLVSLVIGVTYGAVSGYAGGWVDNLMMRIVDVLYSIPFVFLVIFVISVLSEDSVKERLASYGVDRITIFYFVVGAIYWLTMARVVRGQVVSLRNEQYVEAARSLGISQAAIVFRHLVPNLFSVVLVYLTLTIPRVILFEAFLSYPGDGGRAAGRFVGFDGERGDQGHHAGEDLLVADRVPERGDRRDAVRAELPWRRAPRRVRPQDEGPLSGRLLAPPNSRLVNHQMLRSIALLLVGAAVAPAADLDTALNTWIEGEAPSLVRLYRELHAAPELSLQEHNTAARIAKEWSDAGYDVTTGVGGTGVVAVMPNGDGPTVMLRTDLDALPVVEQTGLEYASKVRVKDKRGATVGVMHACGHDVHMANLVGTARVLADRRSDWSGTLVLIAQPAEELGEGAKAMLADGLFARFPRPDYAIALHAANDLAAGTVKVAPGYIAANVDSVDISFAAEAATARRRTPRSTRSCSPRGSCSTCRRSRHAR